MACAGKVSHRVAELGLFTSALGRFLHECSDWYSSRPLLGNSTPASAREGRKVRVNGTLGRVVDGTKYTSTEECFKGESRGDFSHPSLLQKSNVLTKNLY